MAPTRPTRQSPDGVGNSKVPLRGGSPSTPQRSPIKKRKGGITQQQKQALIDNLQLEITERARRLRAQCNIQAQGLRSRIEIRINRIPMALRKVKMGDLLQKYLDQEQNRNNRTVVPAKDHPTRSNPPRHAQAATRPVGRPPKRMSDAISGDKENEFEHHENAKKKARNAPGNDAPPIRPAQILSPTSSNSRLAARSRPASPTKSQIARPASPMKSGATRSAATASSMLSSMVERAKASRNGTASRKVTGTSNASSSSNGTTAGTRTRRAAAPAASRAPASRPATRNARRVSDNSESSETSTSTVVKRGAAATKAAPTKKSVMSSIRKGVSGATTKKAAAKTAAAAPPATTGTGRVLRKRG